MRRRRDRDRERSLVKAALPASRPSPSGWHRVNCPLCEITTGKPDRRRSLAIHSETLWWSCWKCESVGKLPGGVEGPLPKPDPQPEVEIELPREWEPLCDANDAAAQLLGVGAPQAYMRNRGVDEQVWGEARIGFCDRGRMQGRIVVPVLGRQGHKLKGWVARAVYPDASRKYLYPRGMRRGQLLYNEAALDAPTSTPLLVVEGIFDALPYWPDAVACLGKPTDDQVEIMLTTKRPIAVCLDGDARREARTLCDILQWHGAEAVYVELPPLQDPGSVRVEWLRDRTRKAMEATP